MSLQLPPKPLNLDTPSLQQDTIAILNKIYYFIVTTLSIDEHKKQEILNQIKQQIELVKKLELRMPIIAPMKAGKSTIINALIGGLEIMPSHGAAMTTLPTDVVFDSTLSEPRLSLTDDTFEMFKTIAITLQKIIQSKGIEWAKHTTQQYSHLQGLLTEIQSGIQLDQEIRGTAAIATYLTKLNHLMRLCKLLTGNANLYSSIKEFPRIETPFWHPSVSGIKTLKESTYGKLVIVDTPGPNEAGQSGLRNLVENQLAESSCVLIVLDFIALDSQEAFDLKNMVMKFIKLRGTKNLYVVVNKVDVRDNNPSHHRTPQEVFDFVKSQFSTLEQNQVFEVSALKALAATNVLQILQAKPNFSLANFINSPNANINSFLPLLLNKYGSSWKGQVSNITPATLKLDAEELWIASGFPALLKQIISLLPLAEHHCMRTAMNIASEALRELYPAPLLIDEAKKMYEELN